MHLQTRIELSEYRKALKAGCGAVHKMSHAAHKEGMSHLYTAARLLDKRCLSVTHKANSQLQAMGSNDDWLAHQYHMDHNPFQPATRKHVSKIALVLDVGGHDGARGRAEEVHWVVSNT